MCARANIVAVVTRFKKPRRHFRYSPDDLARRVWIAVGVVDEYVSVMLNFLLGREQRFAAYPLLQITSRTLRVDET